MEDAFDQNEVAFDEKGNGGAPFEADRAQTGQDILALRPTHRK